MNFECPICNDIGNANGESNGLCMVADCGHVFHKKCMSQWQSGGNDTCPSCRQNCKKVFTLYGATLDKEYKMMMREFHTNLRRDFQEMQKQLMKTTAELKEKAKECSLLNLKIVQLKCEIQMNQLRLVGPVTSSYRKKNKSEKY